MFKVGYIHNADYCGIPECSTCREIDEQHDRERFNRHDWREARKLIEAACRDAIGSPDLDFWDVENDAEQTSGAEVNVTFHLKEIQHDLAPAMLAHALRDLASKLDQRFGAKVYRA